MGIKLTAKQVMERCDISQYKFMELYREGVFPSATPGKNRTRDIKDIDESDVVAYEQGITGQSPPDELDKDLTRAEKRLKLAEVNEKLEAYKLNIPADDYRQGCKELADKLERLTILDEKEEQLEYSRQEIEYDRQVVSDLREQLDNEIEALDAKRLEVDSRDKRLSLIADKYRDIDKENGQLLNKFKLRSSLVLRLNSLIVDYNKTGLFGKGRGIVWQEITDTIKQMLKLYTNSNGSYYIDETTGDIK